MTYRHWVDIGITAIRTIIKEGDMRSFQGMQDMFGLRNSNLFRQLQMKDYYVEEIKKG